MKNLVLLTAILFSLAACKKTANQIINRSIVGKWKLSEFLADPGDGSGTWHPVDSSNPSYLEFKKDGTLTVSPYFVKQLSNIVALYLKELKQPEQEPLAYS